MKNNIIAGLIAFIIFQFSAPDGSSLGSGPGESPSVPVPEATAVVSQKGNIDRTSSDPAQEQVADSRQWETVWRFPWGREEGECGLWRYSPGDDESLKDHPYCGPRAFAVDEQGALYLLDTVNQRVNKYDSGGKCLFFFPASAHHTDIIVSREDQRIYLLSSSENLIRAFSPRGELVEEFPLPGDEGLFLELSREGERVRARSNQGSTLELTEGRLKRSNGRSAAREGGVEYRVGAGESGGAVLEIMAPGKTSGRRVPIETTRPLAAARLLGSGSGGAVVHTKEFCFPEEFHRLKGEAKSKRYETVSIYGGKGELLQRLELPDRDESFAPPERRLLIQGGCLYLMRVGDEGVAIQRYPLEMKGGDD